MEIKSSWVKGLVIGGIIVISLAALFIDLENGKEFAQIGLISLIALAKS